MVSAKNIIIGASLATNVFFLGYLIVDQTKEPEVVTKYIEAPSMVQEIKLEPISSVFPSKPAPRKIFLAPLPSAPIDSKVSQTDSVPSSAVPTNSLPARPKMPSANEIALAVKERFKEENMGLKKTNLFETQEKGKVVSLKKKEVVKKSSAFTDEWMTKVAKMRNIHDGQAAVGSEVKSNSVEDAPITESANSVISNDDPKLTEKRANDSLTPEVSVEGSNVAVDSGEVTTTNTGAPTPTRPYETNEVADVASISRQTNARRSKIIPTSSEFSSDSKKTQRKKRQLINVNQ